MASPPSFDTFYLQRFATFLLPLSLVAAAFWTEALAISSVIRARSEHPWLSVVSISVGVLMFLLAGLCRWFARRDHLQGAVLVTLAFGGIASTIASVAAFDQGRGSVSTLPAAMMMCFIGGMVAQRYWHLVVAWVVVVGPILVVASLEPPVVPQQDYQFWRFCLGMAFMTTFFYWAVMKIKRDYYDTYIQLSRESRTDDLCGLLNRRAWTADVAGHLTRLRGDDVALLLYLDVDHFKWVNDGDGHDGGDRVLVQVARTLQSVFGPGATIGRMGGDEFVIFRETCQDAAGTVQEARRCLETLRAALYPVTVSVGGAFIPANASLPDVLREADRALFRAKHEGRDRLVMDCDAVYGETVDPVSNASPEHRQRCRGSRYGG